MNRISELRKKLGLTQTRLGEEIGVSQQTISKYENVDENISGDMLLALSLNFQPEIALKASQAEKLHVIGTLNLCFSHTHIMFFRKFKSCL